jgi:CspA family cold shock protein
MPAVAATTVEGIIGNSIAQVTEKRHDKIARENSAPPPDPIGTSGTAVGIVKWWLDAKGYGAIAIDALAPWDVWCHFSQIDDDGFRSLTPGERVEVDYFRVDRESFKYVAQRVHRLAD